MSRVELHLELLEPINDRVAARIAEAHSLYGILRAQLTPSLDELIVEYDASRLTPEEVVAALHRFGIPCRQKEPTAASTHP